MATPVFSTLCGSSSLTPQHMGVIEANGDPRFDTVLTQYKNKKRRPMLASAWR
jgi:hypothetical protein